MIVVENMLKVEEKNDYDFFFQASKHFCLGSII